MTHVIKRHHFRITEKARLEDFLELSDGKIGIYFGETSESYPCTDHGCIVERLADTSYSYTVEGHGIGSNAMPAADLSNTVRRIFSDCQRFGGGDTVTAEVKSKNTTPNKSEMATPRKPSD